MRLATFIAPGSDVPVGGEVRGDAVVAFGDGSTVLDRLASGDRTPASGAERALADVRLLAPVPRPPAIFCIGRNYGAHIAEMGSDAPAKPLVFLKLGPSSVAPNDPVDPPAAARGKLDYEGELAVVIGAGGAVAGYAVANDLSARDLQGSEQQWSRAKGFDASCPWGPWITTADEVADPGALGLRTWVNGEQRQDASTKDLIFPVERLVSFIGETCALEPGALVLTGTPSGVGHAMDPPRYLASGDIVRIEVDELGAIEHRIV
ncbi:MAG TPA: fumarylacetoacetate hydrolase family protein [Solirubrobacteraceae bacterium]|jgi:2-keto-4-pentenoate hydratase/2-oxohepta-3-ene-1,7-dioic acid hydratase in catechol pathway|nr:fumarylacetoacetate hydrolase family protein [Solirubrobacteraceae bacterium]